MRIRLWLPATVLAVLVTVGAAAARPASDASWRLEYTQRANIVEQQTPGGALQPDPALWVTNPTGCVWDLDDVARWLSGGLLPAGASVSTQGCLVADGISHIARLSTALEGLLLSLTVGGISVSGGGAVCVDGPWYDNSAPLPPVGGANGGAGVVTTVTFTITNATSKRIRDARSSGEIVASYSGDSCPPFGERQGVYPGPWWRTT